MINKFTTLFFIFTFSGCVVMPETARVSTQNYQCALSTDKKTLKVVNLMDGDTSFYEWNDEIFSIITMPTSAIISSAYVAVNNIYYFGEKQIKCGNKNVTT